MAIIVKAQITITEGFDTWQAMVKSQEARMEELGMKFLFADTEKDNPNQLHAIMMFPSMEALQTFGGDEELTEIRRQAGAVIESGLMTPISGDYFTNYPNAHIKHQICPKSKPGDAQSDCTYRLRHSTGDGLALPQPTIARGQQF